MQLATLGAVDIVFHEVDSSSRVSHEFRVNSLSTWKSVSQNYSKNEAHNWAHMAYWLHVLGHLHRLQLQEPNKYAICDTREMQGNTTSREQERFHTHSNRQSLKHVCNQV